MAELDYELPRSLIATTPSDRRDASRLMVLRWTQGTIEHEQMESLPDLLERGDLLVRNDTRVVPARLIGRRQQRDGGRGGGRVEGLYLEQAGGSWRVLLTGAGRLQAGEVLTLTGPTGRSLDLELTERDGPSWWCRPRAEGTAAALLAVVGYTPLPPYILKARTDRGESVSDEQDRDWYQTTYAASEAGSVAAPTAGLHLTDGLRSRAAARGIEEAAVTLHVGEGTFRPVTAETLDAHRMHRESWAVTPEAVAAIQSATRVVAVGTTSVRVLETLPGDLQEASLEGVTDLLIAPGYRFKRVGGLLTNFHLPRSTLLALVAALAGLDFVLEAYRQAVRHQYRFYSYGDAMLVIP